MDKREIREIAKQRIEQIYKNIKDFAHTLDDAQRIDHKESGSTDYFQITGSRPLLKFDDIDQSCGFGKPLKE